jgi:hypothetical protein
VFGCSPVFFDDAGVPPRVSNRVTDPPRVAFTTGRAASQHDKRVTVEPVPACMEFAQALRFLGPIAPVDFARADLPLPEGDVRAAVAPLACGVHGTHAAVLLGFGTVVHSAGSAPVPWCCGEG